MPVAPLARLPSDRGISSVPVVDPQGRLLGTVTKAVPVRRLAGAEDKPAARLLRLFRNADQQAGRYARTDGREARRDVMTAELVTVSEDATAEHCARLMEEHGVKRLPVVRDSRLVGFVSRAGLLLALVEPPGKIDAAAQDRDDRIRAVQRTEMR